MTKKEIEAGEEFTKALLKFVKATKAEKVIVSCDVKRKGRTVTIVPDIDVFVRMK